MSAVVFLLCPIGVPTYINLLIDIASMKIPFKVRQRYSEHPPVLDYSPNMFPTLIKVSLDPWSVYLAIALGMNCDEYPRDLLCNVRVRE